MSNKLKPCPFCLCENKEWVCIDREIQVPISYYKYRVTCGKCLAKGPLKRRKYEAIEAWNRRAEE
ncbi:MAG: Lar family restriction alleviation protein [Staphylococcus sp.]|nr:Lar family restriction alleviation protein [Staphylococcus sp.]